VTVIRDYSLLGRISPISPRFQLPPRAGWTPLRREPVVQALDVTGLTL
jgi:hypothetical protein